ncbi:MAG: hypothetical protein LC795_04855 [Acidobacteria bacterium]|nr:hypothetical protein [Acidobacteriota bacterium]
MVREAFYNVRRARGLCAWDLDDKAAPPFLHESNSDRLTVSLVRGDTERTSFSLHIRSLVRPDGGVTAERLEGEIEAALREKGFLRGRQGAGRRLTARAPL